MYNKYDKYDKIQFFITENRLDLNLVKKNKLVCL